MSTNLFYIIIHPRGNLNRVMVTDLSYDNSGERSDFKTVNDIDFTNKDQAIESAIDYARSNRITYEGFDSRYC